MTKRTKLVVLALAATMAVTGAGTALAAHASKSHAKVAGWTWGD